MLSAENKKIKVLMVGDFVAAIHEPAVSRALRKIGEEVYEFAVWPYFEKYAGRISGNPWRILKFLYYRLQNKFNFGPTIGLINADLSERAKQVRPDLVFIYRGTKVWGKTIAEIKKSGALVFGFSNDDPFGKNYPFYVWRVFRRAIKFYDHIFYYRQKNVEDYRKIGFGNVSLLRSHYVRELSFPIPSVQKNKYTCDVAFVGHFEDDERDEAIKAIFDAGIDFQLRGPEWSRSKYHKYFLDKMGEIGSVKGDYNLALNSAKIALVFLSKLNSDTYTRRCFEIPAAGTFMLAEYSEDLAGLFKPGIEADYFKNKEELLGKIKYYLSHEEERKKIATAGRERLLKDGHEVTDRAREVIRVYNSYRK